MEITDNSVKSWVVGRDTKTPQDRRLYFLPCISNADTGTSMLLHYVVLEPPAFDAVKCTVVTRLALKRPIWKTEMAMADISLPHLPLLFAKGCAVSA